MSIHALCIGTNYPGTPNALAGCVNDAHDWQRALEYRGATVGAVLVDHDATRQNILKGIADVLGQLGSGDLAVVTWSGHGTWVPDTDGDEADHRDEAICPNDLNTGLITDDDLYQLFSARPRGSQAVMISDSCHSGTMQRLAAPLAPDKAEHHLVRFIPPTVWADAADIPRSALERAAAAPARGRMRSGALTLTACRDVEVAYDAWFGGRANGAFTRVAIDALAGLGDSATYRGWLRAIRERLPSQDYVQTPQLDGTSAQKRRRVFQ